MHRLGMQTRHEVFNLNTRLYALIEELLARGQIDLRSLEDRRERLQPRELERVAEQAHVQVADNIDKYALKDTPKIDCASLIPICKGRCCKLQFPLSFQDLDERRLQWDYSRPYQIRKRDDQYCVHSDPVSHACTVYDCRPAICRGYDCRNDRRIWEDFDKRIPAPEDTLDSAKRSEAPSIDGPAAPAATASAPAPAAAAPQSAP